VPMLRNFLGAQVNVTEGRVDETTPCARQRRTRDEDIPPMPCYRLPIVLGADSGSVQGTWGWKRVDKEFGAGRGILKRLVPG
jgi:hypothetical protein